MSKKDEFRPGKSKVTVVMLQIDASDDAVKEGIRTISQAMAGFGKPAQTLLVNTPATQIPPKDTPEAQPPPVDTEEETQNGHSENEGERTTRVNRIFKTPSVLDLDLKGDTISLKDFCEKKNVGDNDSKRYLAIAVWLKDQLKITEVTADHIYTCYRHMGWHPPKDIGSPLRSMKRKSGYFAKGNAVGAYAVNHVGESALDGSP